MNPCGSAIVFSFTDYMPHKMLSQLQYVYATSIYFHGGE